MSRQLATINTQGATYTATENCWVIGSVQQSVVNGTAAVYIDGKDAALALSANMSAGLVGMSACLPVMAGQVVTTRSNNGSYNLKVYGML